jgi:hypothetical protein
MTETSLRDALVDVRKASRLLRDFNERMFDMARAVDESLVGYSFEGIWNLHRIASDPLKDWSPQDTEFDYWGTLPFGSTGFVWVRRARPEIMDVTDRLFGIQISADDHLLDEEEDVRKWPSPEIGTSSIGFFLGNPTEEMAKFDAVKMFNRFDYGTPLTRLQSNRKRSYHVYNTFNLDAFTTNAQVQEAAADFLATAEPLLSAP